jgi:hypothetical protein
MSEAGIVVGCEEQDGFGGLYRVDVERGVGVLKRKTVVVEGTI